MDFVDKDLLFQVTPIEQISPRGWPRYASCQPMRMAYIVAD